MSLHYKTHDLNWLLVIENKAGTQKIALDPEQMGRALLGLKQIIFPTLEHALFIGVSEFIPLRDYVLYNFDKAFQAHQDEIISTMTKREPPHQVFHQAAMTLDKAYLEDMDFISPSLYHQEVSKNDTISIYILPIKINCLLDSGEYLLALASMLENEKKIKSLIDYFSNSDAMKPLFNFVEQKPILSPVLKDTDLKAVIKGIQSIKRKYGKSF